VLVPFNADADTEGLKLLLEQYIAGKNETMVEAPKPNSDEHVYPYYTFFAHPKNCKQ
jgi:hypothetical protein